MVTKIRDETIDILRGIAMLLVVLGHTMTGCTINAENSFLFNVIWTLQMPLFMLISGYVNKYSKPITSVRTLIGFLMKRSRSYLLPFAVWTFLIRGIVFGQSGYLNIKSLVYNMDEGYWFLFSVWSIAVILGVADFLGEKLFGKKGEYGKLAGTTFFYICSMAVLTAIGYFMGLSFLCIKLTLYYMPFYYAGYLYGKLNGKLSKRKYFATMRDAAVGVSFVAWIFFMNRYNFYEIGEEILDILLRASVSLFGCVAVCGLIGGILNAKEGEERGHNLLYKIFLFAGKNSLEIYLSHYLLLSMVKAATAPVFASPLGFVLIAGNYLLTLVAVYGFVNLVHRNMVLNAVLFAKR